MLRHIGKLIAGAAVAAVGTYIGRKFMQWAGVLRK